MSKRGIGAFLFGGLLGAGIALLYAPRSGKETREAVSEKVNDVWGQAQGIGASATTNVSQFAHDVGKKSQEVYGSAASKFQETTSNVKPVFAEKSDELRNKIEAARQRISSQVVKNAEAAHEAVSNVVSVGAGAEVTEETPSEKNGIHAAEMGAGAGAEVATEAVAEAKSAAENSADVAETENKDKA
jgi:gas vesicle protein